MSTMIRGVSYKTVMTRLSFDWERLEVSKLDNWILTGLGLLNINAAKIPKICTVYSCGGEAEMPDDLRTIDQLYAVAYKLRDNTKPLVESLCSCHKIDKSCLNDSKILSEDFNPLANTGEIEFSNPNPILENELLTEVAEEHTETCPTILLSDYMRVAYRIVNRGIMFHPELNYYDFLGSTYYNYAWKPLYLSDFPVTNCNDDNCDKFNFDGTGKIRFGLCRDVIVSFAYLGEQTNCQNEILIPDDEQVIEALVFYTTMRYWEGQANAKREGAYQMWKDYEQKWYARMASVRGSSLLPTPERGRRLKQIIYAGITYANQYSAANVGGKYLNLISFLYGNRSNTGKLWNR